MPRPRWRPRSLIALCQSARDAPTKDDLFKTIQDLAYIPTLKSGIPFAVAPKGILSGGSIPPLIQKALDQAKAESKQFILVKGTGDN